jgi:hypothetical protein
MKTAAVDFFIHVVVLFVCDMIFYLFLVCEMKMVEMKATNNFFVVCWVEKCDL